MGSARDAAQVNRNKYESGSQKSSLNQEGGEGSKTVNKKEEETKLESSSMGNNKENIVCYNCTEAGHYSSKCNKPRLCFICRGKDHAVDGCPDWKKQKRMARLYGSASKGLGFIHIDVDQRPDRVNHWCNFDNCGVLTIEEGEMTVEDIVRNMKNTFDKEWAWTVRPLGDYSYLVRFPPNKKVEAIVFGGTTYFYLDKEGVMVSLKAWCGDIEPVEELVDAWVQVKIKVAVRDPAKIPRQRLLEMKKKIYLVSFLVDGVVQVSGGDPDNPDNLDDDDLLDEDNGQEEAEKNSKMDTDGAQPSETQTPEHHYTLFHHQPAIKKFSKRKLLAAQKGIEQDSASRHPMEQRCRSNRKTLRSPSGFKGTREGGFRREQTTEVNNSQILGCILSLKPHGKWATFNAAVNGTEALAEIRGDRDSLRAAKRQREEQGDREKRRQAHDARVAREYAKTVLEWGKGIEQRDNSVQKFMETVARQLGMPTSAVPPPLPPLPPAPVFCASASSNPPPSSPLANANGASASNADVASPAAHASPDNDDTFGSAIGMDNPVETLQRIARGVFGGYGNGAACGGGRAKSVLGWAQLFKTIEEDVIAAEKGSNIKCVNLLREMELVESDEEEMYDKEETMVLGNRCDEAEMGMENLPPEWCYEDDKMKQLQLDEKEISEQSEMTRNKDGGAMVNKKLWGPVVTTRRGKRHQEDGRTVMQMAQDNKRKMNLEVPKGNKTNSFALLSKDEITDVASIVGISAPEKALTWTIGMSLL
ncbi:hypothetical protein EJB05_24298, partial [Eragrostis curvula]